MNAVLKKMLYKGQSPALLLNAPAEFEPQVSGFEGEVDRAPKGTYGFVLAFAKSLAEAEEAARAARPALSKDALFWLAYPKGTSKRYKSDPSTGLRVNINRDTGNAALQKQGLQVVAMVSIDDDWSAMRFRPTA